MVCHSISQINPGADVTVIPENITLNIPAKFPELFDGLGTLPGKYTIYLSDNAPFAISMPRRVALPLLPKVKGELERMENSGHIKS